jgi:transposase-like protein
MRKRYTDEQRSALVDLVNEEGATVSEAARHLGVTASTAYQWMKRAAEGPEQPRGRSSRGAGAAGRPFRRRSFRWCGPPRGRRR